MTDNFARVMVGFIWLFASVWFSGIFVHPDGSAEEILVATVAVVVAIPILLGLCYAMGTIAAAVVSVAGFDVDL